MFSNFFSEKAISMQKMLVFAFVLYLGLSGCSSAQDSMIAPNATPKSLGNQFQFTEGPLWLPEQQVLLFSDVPANKMYQYDPEKGFSIFRDPSNFSNGNILDQEGNLITAQHDRTITKTDKKGNITIIAKEYNGKKLNSPNDLVLAANGDIYFSDPHFGIIGIGAGPEKAPEEQPVRGIYRIKKDQQIELLSGDLAIPNGLAFSPKQDILYATNSADGAIYCFDVKADGTLANLRLFANQPKQADRQPNGDGIKVDLAGNVYAGSPNGVAIYSPSGKLLEEILLPKSASNLCWGGKDYKTLFITVSNEIYSILTLIGGSK